MDTAEQLQAQAGQWYQQGVAYRKSNQLGQARNCFLKALEADPTYRQASVALEMIDAIQEYGNTDMYNV